MGHQGHTSGNHRGVHPRVPPARHVRRGSGSQERACQGIVRLSSPIIMRERRFCTFPRPSASRHPSHSSAPQLIEAEGEEEAAQALTRAAEIISATPGALQLRYLQTMSQHGQNGGAALFPMPTELGTGLFGPLCAALG
jgi:hypothetical protein